MPLPGEKGEDDAIKRERQRQQQRHSNAAAARATSSSGGGEATARADGKALGEAERRGREERGRSRVSHQASRLGSFGSVGRVIPRAAQLLR